MITQIDAIEKVLGGKSVVLGVGTGIYTPDYSLHNV